MNLVARVMKVAHAAHRALRIGVPFGIRATQYKHKPEINLQLKNHNSWVRQAVGIIASTIGVKQWELGVVGFGKGRFSGAGFQYKTEYDEVFGSDTMSKDIPNPAAIKESFVDAGTDTLMYVESESAFNSLVQGHFVRRYPDLFAHTIIFTSSGYGDYATRYWGHLVQSRLRPDATVVAITDPNPNGLYIYMTMKFGSVGMKPDSDILVMPSLQRIGVNLEEIPGDKRAPLINKDITLAVNMTNHPNIEDAIAVEIENQLENECKGEIENLGDGFVQYVYQKLLELRNRPQQPIKLTRMVQDLEPPLIPMIASDLVAHWLTKLEVLTPTAALMRVFTLSEIRGQQLKYSIPNLPAEGSWPLIVVTETQVAVSRHSVMHVTTKDAVETAAQSYDAPLLSQIFRSFKEILESSQDPEIQDQYRGVMANMELRHQVLLPVWYGTEKSKNPIDLLCIEWAINKVL